MQMSLQNEILKGEICEQYIACNKSNCRCQNGDLHGPYYYRVWREGTKVKRQYVRAVELQTVREGCDRFRSIRSHLKESNRRLLDLSGKIKKHSKRVARH